MEGAVIRFLRSIFTREPNISVSTGDGLPDERSVIHGRVDIWGTGWSQFSEEELEVTVLPDAYESSWKAEVVIDDSAISLLFEILLADANAGFSNSELKSPVYNATYGALARLVGNRRLELFEQDLNRLPSWRDYDKRFFGECDGPCGTLVPKGSSHEKGLYCDNCIANDCSLHSHCKGCGECDAWNDEFDDICWECQQMQEEEEEEEAREQMERDMEREAELAERQTKVKEDQDWEDEFWGGELN